MKVTTNISASLDRILLQSDRWSGFFHLSSWSFRLSFVDFTHSEDSAQIWLEGHTDAFFDTPTYRLIDTSIWTSLLRSSPDLLSPGFCGRTFGHCILYLGK